MDSFLPTVMPPPPAMIITGTVSRFLPVMRAAPTISVARRSTKMYSRDPVTSRDSPIV